MTTKDEVRDWREEIVKEWMEKGFAARLFDDTEVAKWWLETFDTLLAKKREEIAKMKKKIPHFDTETNRKDVYAQAVNEVLSILTN